MSIELTQYYDEYLRYFELAKRQQDLCNLGNTPYSQSGVNDSLMENVELYDVVERKYAGFSQIINDCFYGWTDAHPYWNKMRDDDGVSFQRKIVARDWDGKHAQFKLPEWIYLFILHRVTGSGINYSVKPSGYHNTIIFQLHECDTIEDMVKMVNGFRRPFYTSVGYQFPSFPKPPENSQYKRGGDYYLTEYAPRLARDMAEWLERGPARDFRELGGFMLDWNLKNGLRRYFFHYAAVIADIADWYPEYVNRDSMFYYGSNARECISYLAKPTSKMNQDDFLDRVMAKIFEDTGSFPYNAEDVCCDYIRWVENYIKPGRDYGHLDFDSVWSSCKIKDHPFGRQENMLKLKLVETFNGISAHPSDDVIIKKAGLDVSTYQEQCRKLNTVH